MKYFRTLHLIVVLLLCTISITMGQHNMLPSVVLKGDDGGTINGEEWKSDNLTGKTNIVLYVDPGKKESVTPLIDKIDSLSYSTDVLGITFIVNTKATFIPDLIIKKMIGIRAEKNKKIQYVLDQNKVLIKKWNFTDEYVNVLVLNTSGKTLHRYAGEITEEYINKLINKITIDVK